MRKLGTVAKSPIPYVSNATRERQVLKGFTANENFRSDLPQAGWQFDRDEVVTLCEGVHVKGVDFHARNVHQSEQFAALKSSVPIFIGQTPLRESLRRSLQQAYLERVASLSSSRKVSFFFCLFLICILS